MLGFGVIGFLMEKAHLPLAAFVIGFVLAPLAEKNLCSGLGASGGSYLELFTRPISLVFLLLAITLVLLPLRGRKPRDSSHRSP
jgi:putative tricarboxylic transport membrane protein